MKEERSLRGTLREFALKDPLPAGGPSQSSRDIKELRGQLLSVARSNELYFRVCLACAVVLFAVSLLTVWWFRADVAKAQIVLGVLGVSVMGLVRFMMRLWQDKARTEMLILLAPSLDEKNLQTIVTVLARKL